VFFPCNQKCEEEVVKKCPPAPRPAGALCATGQLIALPYYAFAEQADFEVRLRRLEQVEGWMTDVAVENMKLEDAYEILEVCIDEEYTNLYSEDFQAYAQLVIRMANSKARADAKLFHPDKLSNDFTRPLEGRCSEALKYVWNALNMIKDMCCVQNIPPVERPTIMYILSSVPVLLLKWKTQDYATAVCITVGNDQEGDVVVSDERTVEPGGSCVAYYYDEHPSLFDDKHPSVFHLCHIGVNRAQEGMRSPATRCTAECPEEYCDIIEEIKQEQRGAELKVREAELRAKIARTRAELKREREAAGDRGTRSKRRRHYEDWGDAPPWRQSSEWRAPPGSLSASSWKSWGSRQWREQHTRVKAWSRW
jgi:hypothetical protein